MTNRYPIQAIASLNSEYPISDSLNAMAVPAITAKRNPNINNKTKTTACGSQKYAKLAKKYVFFGESNMATIILISVNIAVVDFSSIVLFIIVPSIC